MGQIRKWSDRTGLENLKDFVDGVAPISDAMGETLNLELIEVREGICIYEGKPGEQHRNPRGLIHGGWAMSILDAAAVLAVVTALPKGKLCATSSLEVKFARPIKAGMTCRAEGELQSMGINLAHAKAKLIDIETGKLLAFCTCSASIYDVVD
ncbi:MAG: PaaI family thioesterase [Robiginitomaculum sp.]|nr:PaaI family thioesterase [Robiginitomaculum sp.]MCF6274363.1 PaaI family thioesterase [Robiginitomaculum sp.]